MSTRKRSRIWTYFDETEEDNTKVKCSLCNALISRSGVGRTASTTAMLNHVRIKHKDESMGLTEEESVSETSRSRNSGASTSSAASKTTMVQQTLSESFVAKWDINDPRAKEIHKSIAEMIATDNQPISIVEDAGFQRLMHALKPKYQVPGRKYMSEVVIPDIYDKVKTTIKTEIDKAEAVSITTDIWTCMNNLLGFISYTAHWLSEDFVLQHRVLQMKQFTGSHTANNIRSVLSDLSEAWEIDTKIHVILRDNGPNIVKAINDSMFVGKGCYIHTLQLAVNASLKIPYVNEAIVIARRIVSHFNHSTPANEKLVAIQKELKLPAHALVQDVPTRWNSTYYMSQRLIEQKRAISLYISDNSSRVNFEQLTERQWQILKESLMLLKPFEEITKIISSSVASISEVIPHTNALLKYLEKPEVSEICQNIADMQQKLQEEVKTRFEGLEDDKYYCLATLLDPRFRLRFFHPDKCEQIKRRLFSESIRQSDATDSTSSSESELNPHRLQHSQDAHATFWSCFEELASTRPIQHDEPKSPIALELDRYVKEGLLSRDQSPFNWWMGHKTRYPQMARLARIFLCAPASSVYSERLFSEAGNVYEEK